MNDETTRKTARLAGVFYLVLFICGFFTLYVRAAMIDPAVPEDTIANISGSEFLYRLAIVAEFILALAYLMVAFCLRQILATVDTALSLLFFVIAAIGVTLIIGNTLNQIALLEIATNPIFLTTQDDELQAALSVVFTWQLNNGWMLVAIATGLWLLPLGIVVLKAAFFPKFLGYLMIAGCFGYLVPVAITFLAPDYRASNLPLMSVSGIAEIIFGIWLLAFGTARRSS